jgi:hypothetical protein
MYHLELKDKWINYMAKTNSEVSSIESLLKCEISAFETYEKVFEILTKGPESIRLNEFIYELKMTKND